MFVSEKEILLSPAAAGTSLLSHFRQEVQRKANAGVVPVRFVVTETRDDAYQCELGVISGRPWPSAAKQTSIFDYRQRVVDRTNHFNAALIIPTGIGAELGGHSGDGGAIARLVASACDALITHPNVVNAADINELPDNGYYVEGSVLTRLLMGTVGLQRVRGNRVILLVEEHEEKMFHELSINSASAARASLGLDCPLVVKMRNTILMRAFFSSSGRAVGQVDRLENLCRILDEHRGEFDAIALATLIQVPEHFHSDYFTDETGDMVNPWGGVEAMLTHAVSHLYNLPSAHSPMMSSREVMNLDVGITDPRKAAEAVSTTYLHCVLKGLHRSPRILTDASAFSQRGVLSVEDVSCVIIPDGCLGLPTLAALEQGIPVIAVRENRNRMKNRLSDLPFGPGKLFVVDNYLEAVGVMAALRSGVAVNTVRRPMLRTKIIEVDGSDSIPSSQPEAIEPVTQQVATEEGE